MKQKNILLMVGTRPEAIKLAPLYQELLSQKIPTRLCAMGQHAELLHDVLRLFRIKPDISVNIMKPNQDLFYLLQTALKKAKQVLRKERPSLVVVQGDTMSAMASALAAFFFHIPVAHVEAGLRTATVQRPFPEELNRRIVTLIAALHFAPTAHAVEQLTREKVDPHAIFHTGNTIVDALLQMKREIECGTALVSPLIVKEIEKQKKQGRKIGLLTTHRRESFGKGLQSIFRAMQKALQQHPELYLFFPVHPNPAILDAIEETALDKTERIWMTPPLAYPDLVHILDSSDLVITDSGGIQEEAVSLNKPVLVLRQETDRPEGRAYLVGTDEERILSSLHRVLKHSSASPLLPFGDGTASQRIAQVLQAFLAKI